MSTLPTRTVVTFPEQTISLEAAFLRGLPCEATRKVYARALTAFGEFLGGEALLSASRRDVEAYRSLLEAKRRAPATIAKVMSALSSFFTFAVEEEAVDRNPAASARRPRVSDLSPRRALSPSEVRSILQAAEVGTLLGLRDRAMLTMLAVQGWRAGEVLKLAVEDLCEEQGHKVATVHGKGGKVIRVPLAAATWQVLHQWIAAARITEGPVFLVVGRGGQPKHGASLTPQAMWKRIRLLGRRAHIGRPVHAHLFRHTAITVALDAGVQLHLVQDLARHADPATTRRYDSHRQSLQNPAPHVLADRLMPCFEDEGI